MRTDTKFLGVTTKQGTVEIVYEAVSFFLGSSLSIKIFVLFLAVGVTLISQRQRVGILVPGRKLSYQNLFKHVCISFLTNV